MYEIGERDGLGCEIPTVSVEVNSTVLKLDLDVNVEKSTAVMGLGSYLYRGNDKKEWVF